MACIAEEPPQTKEHPLRSDGRRRFAFVVDRWCTCRLPTSSMQVVRRRFRVRFSFFLRMHLRHDHVAAARPRRRASLPPCQPGGACDGRLVLQSRDRDSWDGAEGKSAVSIVTCVLDHESMLGGCQRTVPIAPQAIDGPSSVVRWKRDPPPRIDPRQHPQPDPPGMGAMRFRRPLGVHVLTRNFPPGSPPDTIRTC